MNRRLEEKILQKLQDKVLERDSELQRQRDHSDVRKATKEALAEMTNLSRAEVDAIAKEVHDEIYRKHHIRQRIIIGVAALVIIIGAVMGYNKITEKPPVTFTETFSDLSNGWALLDKYEYKRYFENGKYHIDANKDGWHYWQNIPFEFPEKYRVELKTHWYEGQTDEGYGLILMKNTDTYLYFFINAEGQARQGVKVDGTWKTTDEFTDGYAKKSNGDEVENIITVDVEANNFVYAINGTRYLSGDLKNIDVQKIGVAVSGEQHAAFDWIKVTDLTDATNPKVILDEPFENETQTLWETKEEIEEKSWLKDNKMYFQHNREDYCEWSSIFLPENLSDHFQIEATMEWVAGDNGDFGIMLMQNRNYYYSFECSKMGKARVVSYMSDKYDFIGDYINIGQKFGRNDLVAFKITVEQNRVAFFINNIFVFEDKLEKIEYRRIGIRVCDEQTVAFDNIHVSDIKK